MSIKNVIRYHNVVKISDEKVSFIFIRKVNVNCVTMDLHKFSSE